MKDSTGPVNLKHAVHDHGPIYTETDMTKPLPEPWNGFSSLSFVLAGMWWLYFLRKKLSGHIPLAICMVILIINGVGSTLFHATRASRWFLMMDWMPIMLLGLILIFYFWARALSPAWWLTFLIIPGLVVLIRYARNLIEVNGHQASISLSYGMMAACAILPVAVHLIRTKGKHWKWILAGGIMYGLGMFFREADRWEPHLLPMGTHWLWHVFNGLGAGLVTAYVYHDIEDTKAKRKQRQSPAGSVRRIIKSKNRPGFP